MRQARHQIEGELRRRIRAGVYATGSRLPSRRELQGELGGSPLTVQAAFDQLARQGWIVPRGSRGTFVAERLPDRSTIALFFNDEPEKGSWNRFWSALHRVADGWRGDEVLRPYCLAGGRPEGEEYRRLCADLDDGALAGLVFTSPLLFTDRSPVYTAALPRVSIGRQVFPGPANSLLLVADQPVIEQLLRRWRGEGRTRIAGLAATPVLLARFQALAVAHGFDARPEWWHWVPTDAFGAAAARRIVHLLGTLPPRQRPECLLITDDNLATPATSGALDAGWQAPDVAVAAHANFPLTTRAAVPCLRYGLDAKVVLAAAAAEIARLVGGGQPRTVEVAFTLPGAASGQGSGQA